MKKILLAIGSSEIYGQKVFITCIKEFIKKNYEIIVVLPKGPLVDLLKSYDIKLYVVDFYSISCLIAISKIFKKEKIDIINTYLTRCSLLFSLVNIFYRIPICCTLLNAITHEKLNKIQKQIYPIFYFILSKICDGIIVNSEQNRRHFMEVAKIDGNFIKVIYSGIDIHEFLNVPARENKTGKFVLGVVGRLSKEKGHYYLIEALTFLQDINYECMIIGDGPLRKELENQVEGKNLQDKVKFYGFQNNIAVLMQQMDAVIVPSLNETFGVTIIEAFASKKVVIASEVGGIPELVKHKITGLLFPVKDSSGLVERILYVYNNKAEAVKMEENAYEYVMQNFTSSIMAENTLAFYNSILNKND